MEPQVTEQLKGNECLDKKRGKCKLKFQEPTGSCAWDTCSCSVQSTGSRDTKDYISDIVPCEFDSCSCAKEGDSTAKKETRHTKRNRIIGDTIPEESQSSSESSSIKGCKCSSGESSSPSSSSTRSSDKSSSQESVADSSKRHHRRRKTGHKSKKDPESVQPGDIDFSKLKPCLCDEKAAEQQNRVSEKSSPNKCLCPIKTEDLDKHSTHESVKSHESTPGSILEDSPRISKVDTCSCSIGMGSPIASYAAKTSHYSGGGSARGIGSPIISKLDTCSCSVRNSIEDRASYAAKTSHYSAAGSTHGTGSARASRADTCSCSVRTSVGDEASYAAKTSHYSTAGSTRTPAGDEASYAAKTSHYSAAGSASGIESPIISKLDTCSCSVRTSIRDEASYAAKTSHYSAAGSTRTPAGDEASYAAKTSHYSAAGSARGIESPIISKLDTCSCSLRTSIGDEASYAAKRSHYSAAGSTKTPAGDEASYTAKTSHYSAAGSARGIESPIISKLDTCSCSVRTSVEDEASYAAKMSHYSAAGSTRTPAGDEASYAAKTSHYSAGGSVRTPAGDEASYAAKTSHYSAAGSARNMGSKTETCSCSLRTSVEDETSYAAKTSHYSAGGSVRIPAGDEASYAAKTSHYSAAGSLRTPAGDEVSNAAKPSHYSGVSSARSAGSSRTSGPVTCSCSLRTSMEDEASYVAKTSHYSAPGSSRGIESSGISRTATCSCSFRTSLGDEPIFVQDYTDRHSARISDKASIPASVRDHGYPDQGSIKASTQMSRSVTCSCSARSYEGGVYTDQRSIQQSTRMSERSSVPSSVRTPLRGPPEHGSISAIGYPTKDYTEYQYQDDKVYASEKTSIPGSSRRSAQGSAHVSERPSAPPSTRSHDIPDKHSSHLSSTDSTGDTCTCGTGSLYKNVEYTYPTVPSGHISELGSIPPSTRSKAGDSGDQRSRTSEPKSSSIKSGIEQRSGFGTLSSCSCAARSRPGSAKDYPQPYVGQGPPTLDQRPMSVEGGYYPSPQQGAPMGYLPDQTFTIPFDQTPGKNGICDTSDYPDGRKICSPYLGVPTGTEQRASPEVSPYYQQPSFPRQIPPITGTIQPSGPPGIQSQYYQRDFGQPTSATEPVYHPQVEGYGFAQSTPKYPLESLYDDPRPCSAPQIKEETLRLLKSMQAEKLATLGLDPGSLPSAKPGKRRSDKRLPGVTSKSLGNERHKLEREIAECKCFIAEQEHEIEKLTGHVEDLSKKREGLQDRMSHAMGQLKGREGLESSSASSTDSTDTSQLKRLIQELQRECRHIQQKLKKTEDECLEIKTIVKNKENMVEAMQNECKKILNDKEKDCAITGLKKSLEAVRSENQNLMDLLNKARSLSDDDKTQMMNRFNCLEKQLIVLRTKIKQQEDDCNVIKTSLKEKEKMIQEISMSTKKSALDKEKDNLVATLKKSLEDAKCENAKLQGMVSRLCPNKGDADGFTGTDESKLVVKKAAEELGRVLKQQNEEAHQKISSIVEKLQSELKYTNRTLKDLADRPKSSSGLQRTPSNSVPNRCAQECKQLRRNLSKSQASPNNQLQELVEALKKCKAKVASLQKENVQNVVDL